MTQTKLTAFKPLQDENWRLRAVVQAINEKDPEQPTNWKYSREDLCELARHALEPKP